MGGSRRITANDLRDLLLYDLETGHFWWRTRAQKRVLSKPAGSLCSNGYRYIRVNGVLLLESRLAWLWMTGEWPPAEIDHINLNSTDNRWENLRLATSSQNKCNRRLSRNKNDFKGVYRSGGIAKPWRTCIQVNGKQYSLGRYETPEAAYAAYCNAANRMHGEFVRLE